MNWKISIVILIELGFLFFPANIIGCADPPDPYDEYITFFRNDVAPVKGYKSFYYVEDAVIYDPLAPAADPTDYITRMWVRYCEGRVNFSDADRLVNKSSREDMASLYAHLQKASTPIAPNIRNNPMTVFLLQEHDSVAVKYLLLAKQAEKYTSLAVSIRDDEGEWTIRPKDSIGMSTLIAVALQGQAHSKKDFFRARYGFQAERLAFYDHQYQDCIRFYDELVKDNPASGHLARTGLGYKAGALWHTGRRIEAAYFYSRSFTANPNTSDYLSFSWCVHRFEDSDRRACLAQCINDREKAEMLGLFVLGSNEPEQTALERIYRLAPGTPVQEVLAVREVNKIERNYLTLHLARQKGGRAINDLVYYGSVIPGDKWLEEARSLISFYDSVGRNNKVAHPGLFLAVASQLCYMTRRFGFGDSLLNRAGALPATEKLRDQQKMTRLLLTINETAVVDHNFEKALLPSLQWLERRAHRDSILKAPSEWGNDHPGLWSQIYRNLLSEELAKRYYRQKDLCSEALCIGAAEQAKEPSAGPTLNFVREQMTATELMHLFRLLQGPDKTDWEKYLVSRFPVPADQVKEVIAVAHIREHRFHEALKWMREIKDPALLHLDRNPFADLLFDNQDSVFVFDKGRFDKRTFIVGMAALSDKVSSHRATAKDLYRLATGYYNLTYYGRAWELVRYYRSGNEAADIPEDKTDFDNDYYGCYTAETFFKKAMAASADPEFKARCLFMIAKCSQKQVPMVTWDAQDWDIRHHEFIDKFENNKYFPQLVSEYGNTVFYREAFNTCSYLRDFVKGK
jgi:tetratricopeptide (TPR) repeat protein